MVKRRTRPAEGLIEQDLFGGGEQQIFAPYDLRNGHGMVIGHDGEFVAGKPVFAPHDEVSKIYASGKGNVAEALVLKANNDAIGNLKTPVDAAGLFCKGPI